MGDGSVTTYPCRNPDCNIQTEDRDSDCSLCRCRGENEIPLYIPVYRVTTSDMDREIHLGYATGMQRDIKSFYSGYEVFGLTLSPIKIVDVPSGYMEIRDELNKKKSELESQLRKVESQIQLRSSE